MLQNFLSAAVVIGALRVKLVQISPYYPLILSLKVPIMNAAGHV